MDGPAETHATRENATARAAATLMTADASAPCAARSAVCDLRCAASANSFDHQHARRVTIAARRYSCMLHNSRCVAMDAKMQVALSIVFAACVLCARAVVGTSQCNPSYRCGYTHTTPDGSKSYDFDFSSLCGGMDYAVDDAHGFTYFAQICGTAHHNCLPSKCGHRARALMGLVLQYPEM